MSSLNAITAEACILTVWSRGSLVLSIVSCICKFQSQFDSLFYLLVKFLFCFFSVFFSCIFATSYGE